jgi:two-component system cell cycle sensor histidine kinase/response regulator CckA
VYGIVKQSGGTLQVESSPDAGATFRVFLPCLAEEPEVHGAPREVAHVPGHARATQGHETLLLVEDEAEVRELVARALAAQGYQVLVARDGEEAEALSRQHPGPIHLLLTDVVMPRVRGPEVARRVLASRPETRVMFMSGYASGLGRQADGTGVERAFLSKPFSLTSLLREVQTALGRAPQVPGPESLGEQEVS